MVFGVFRRSKAGALASFRSNIENLAERLVYIDLYTIGRHIAALVLESLRKQRTTDQREEASILEEMSSIIRETLSFSPAALFIADILSAASKLGNEKPLKTALKALSRLLDFASHSSNAITVNLSKEIKYGSTITLLGYSDEVLRIILSASGKLTKVNVLSYWPFMSGRRAVLALRRRGVKAIPWPDTAASQIIEESDYVIVASLGISGEGSIVGEPGLYPLLLLASEYAKESIVIAWSWTMRPSTPEGANKIVKIAHPLDKALELFLPLLDVAPITKADMIVADTGTYRRLTRDIVTDTYEGLLRTLLEGPTTE